MLTTMITHVGRQLWLLFKVSSYDLIKQMQKGLLYMNNLEYFSDLKGEEMSALRSDKLEKIYAYYKSQRRGPISTQILLSVDQEDNQKSFNLGKNSSLTIFFQNLKT